MLKRLIIALIIIFAIGAGGYVWQNNKINMKDYENKAIIGNFNHNWWLLQKDIEFSPVLGSTMWNNPNIFQFIKDDKLLVEFEDGHVAGIAAFSHENGKDFSYITSFGSGHNPEGEFLDWINQNNIVLPDKAYVRLIIRDGEKVAFGDWKLISVKYIASTFLPNSKLFN